MRWDSTDFPACSFTPFLDLTAAREVGPILATEWMGEESWHCGGIESGEDGGERGKETLPCRGETAGMNSYFGLADPSINLAYDTK